MSYRVEMRPEADENLRGLDKAVAQRVLRRLKWLSENFDSLTPQPLTGEWKGLFKARAGSYGAIYDVDRDKGI